MYWGEESEEEGEPRSKRQRKTSSSAGDGSLGSCSFNPIVTDTEPGEPATRLADLPSIDQIKVYASRKP